VKDAFICPTLRVQLGTLDRDLRILILQLTHVVPNALVKFPIILNQPDISNCRLYDLSDVLIRRLGKLCMLFVSNRAIFSLIDSFGGTYDSSDWDCEGGTDYENWLFMYITSNQCLCSDEQINPFMKFVHSLLVIMILYQLIVIFNQTQHPRRLTTRCHAVIGNNPPPPKQ
jgi:hypothetical protein